MSTTTRARLVGASLALAGVLVGGLMVSVLRSNADESAAVLDRAMLDRVMPDLSLPVHAATAQGYDNFAVATGPVDNELEAFYFLDFLTGELRATVLNTRKGEFGAFFQYNIAEDFDIAGSKNPKYLMVTGVANIPRGRGNSQLGLSVIYVTEATSGQMAAYVLPWNSSLQAAGKNQQGTFLKIADVKLRSAVVRDQ